MPPKRQAIKSKPTGKRAPMIVISSSNDSSRGPTQQQSSHQQQQQQSTQSPQISTPVPDAPQLLPTSGELSGSRDPLNVSPQSFKKVGPAVELLNQTAQRGVELRDHRDTLLQENQRLRDQHRNDTGVINDLARQVVTLQQNLQRRLPKGKGTEHLVALAERRLENQLMQMQQAHDEETALLRRRLHLAETALRDNGFQQPYFGGGKGGVWRMPWQKAATSASAAVQTSQQQQHLAGVRHQRDEEEPYFRKTKRSPPRGGGKWNFERDARPVIPMVDPEETLDAAEDLSEWRAYNTGDFSSDEDPEGEIVPASDEEPEEEEDEEEIEMIVPPATLRIRQEEEEDDDDDITDDEEFLTNSATQKQ